MRDDHVGDVVVVEERGEHRVPVGLVTDRDIVVGLLAKDVEHIARLNVGDLLISDVITARESEDVTTVLDRMRHYGVRRVPVVNPDGELVGIFAVDDLLAILAEDLSAVVTLFASGRRREHKQRA